MRVSSRGRVLIKAAVWVAALAPLARLAWCTWTEDLGANPIDAVTDTLGDWALRLLLASLAVTPLRLTTGWSWPVTLRRLLGLFAFFYVAVHFSVWVVLDHFFDWAAMGADILKRPYITVGFTALLLLLPLAATSTAGMVKRLGAARWRRLHALVYVAASLAVLHYVWVGKLVHLGAWLHVAILALLLAVRAGDLLRRRRRRRKEDRVPQPDLLRSTR